MPPLVGLLQPPLYVVERTVADSIRYGGSPSSSQPLDRRQTRVAKVVSSSSLQLWCIEAPSLAIRKSPGAIKRPRFGRHTRRGASVMSKTVGDGGGEAPRVLPGGGPGSPPAELNPRTKTLTPRPWATSSFKLRLTVRRPASVDNIYVRTSSHRNDQK